MPINAQMSFFQILSSEEQLSTHPTYNFMSDLKRHSQPCILEKKKEMKKLVFRSVKVRLLIAPYLDSGEKKSMRDDSWKF